MKLFMFAASLQQHSLNKQLIKLAAMYLQQAGHSIDHADLHEFTLPLYNADIQNSTGFPAAVPHFIARLQAADGCVIATPEYNFSIPGILKNLIDWVSRVSPMPWRNQIIQLLSASPSLVGGNRGLWQTRLSLECCGALVLPDMFSLANADAAFDQEGKLVQPELTQLLQSMLKRFTSLVSKIKAS